MAGTPSYPKEKAKDFPSGSTCFCVPRTKDTRDLKGGIQAPGPIGTPDSFQSSVPRQNWILMRTADLGRDFLV